MVVPVILGLVIVITIIVILVLAIFLIQRRQKKTLNRANHTEMVNLYDEIMTRDIAFTPTMHVEVNERGRFRRRIIESQKNFK